MTDDVETRLSALGLSLPSAPAPVANYVPFCLSGGVLYIGIVYAGKVGTDLSLDDGREAAELCCLNILAQVKAALGGFDRLERCLRLTGFVNAMPDFVDHPKVINGASDLLVALLGDKGRHTRAAVGVSSLPGDAAVEIDAIFAVA